MLNRKSLLLGLTLAGGLMTLTVEAQEATDVSSSTSQQEMRLLRQKATARQRRIIFNNDGDDVAMYCNEATPEALLQIRTVGLLNTQVDTIIYNTAYCFGNFLHRTSIGTPFTSQEGLHANNKVGDFLQQGTDSLSIVVDYCRANDMEIFWSMRMNDIHDGQSSPEAARMFPPFKKEHPELLMISSPVWNEIGTQQTLATVEKVYTTGARTQSAANRFLAGGSRFVNRSTLSPANPRKLKPGQSQKVTLRVAENVDEAKRLGSVPPQVTTRSSVWMEHAVSPELLRQGPNAVSVTLNTNGETDLVLEDLILRSVTKN